MPNFPVLVVEPSLDVELMSWQAQVLDDSARHRAHLAERAVAGGPEGNLMASVATCGVPSRLSCRK
jgi:hypothetical protein